MANRTSRLYRRAMTVLFSVMILCSALLTGAFIATAPLVLQGVAQAEAGVKVLVHNPEEAAQAFTQAERTFKASLAGIRALPEPGMLPSLVPPFSWGVRLNKAAAYLSRAGGDAATIARHYHAQPSNDDPNTLIAAHAAEISKLVERDHQTLDSLQFNLEQANQELAHIPDWILTKELKATKRKLHAATYQLPRARALYAGWQEALGKGSVEPVTALIIFQNDTELRPSGGFMGSYAVLTATNGTIRSFTFGKDIYALDKGLEARERIAVPDHLKTIALWWGFRDSNVGAGFLPDIGTQVAKLYGKAAGTEPRVIIFTDLSILEDILKITGPIQIPGSERVATSDNASTEITHVVEREYWEEEANRQANEPKQVINQMIPLVIQQLRGSSSAVSELPALISRATQRKSLQIWSSNDQLNLALDQIMPSDNALSGDWIKIVNNNLGGKKSSRNVHQEVVLEEQVKKNWLERTVKISRTHLGTGVWPDYENHNYTEIYLPAGAEVVESPLGKGGETLLPLAKQREWNLIGHVHDGEILPTQRWVRVGFWTTTSVAERTDFTLRYRLPRTEEFAGPFTYLKQAGARHETLEAFGYDALVEGNVVLEKRRGVLDKFK
jgi:hypothetical protein